MFGSLFHGFDVLQGQRFSPALLAKNCGFIYMYHALQCPMEALHGRRSLWHNIISAGMMGSAAVNSGQAGIPFVERSFYSMYPRVTPPVLAFVVYGAIGGAMGGLSGKPF